MDDNFVAYITDTVMEMQTHESSLLPALRKQLEETERGITNMLNAIQAGIFNASTKQRLDELEQRKADIELQIIQEEMRHPMLTREDVTYWFCRYRMLDTKRLEERRRLIDGFVNSVIVYDEYIVITFLITRKGLQLSLSLNWIVRIYHLSGDQISRNGFMPFLLISFDGETRTIKCNADERCRRRLDGGELLSVPSGADANESRHSAQQKREANASLFYSTS